MSAAQTDWVDEGRKHFMQTKLRPDRRPANYPTQDTHTPQDEADFISGFNLAKAEWERGDGLNGLQSYILEADEMTVKGVRRVVIREAGQ